MTPPLTPPSAQHAEIQNLMGQIAWQIALWAFLATMILAGMGCSLRQKLGESLPQQKGKIASADVMRNGRATASEERKGIRRREPSSRTEVQGTGEASAAELLPDIDPTAPTGLRVEPDGGRGFLPSFDATFDNVGAGPLHIDGRRLNDSARMLADQVIARSDRVTKLNPGVGELQFVESEDHRYWHFFRFMRCELIRPASGAVVAPDQKTGFCIGDRYNTDPAVRLPGEPPMPGVFDVPPNNDWCGRDDPDRLSLTMGLSVGYGDNYLAFLDGQSIDVTYVPEGSYYLVHRVNADVRESDYSNNAVSLLLKLRWPNGFDDLPTVKILASCPDTVRCSSD